MCGPTTERIRRSRIFTGVQRREMGLYDAGSVGDFFGLRKGTILAVFQREGIWLCVIE